MRCQPSLLAFLLLTPLLRAQSPCERVSLSSSGQEPDALSYAGGLSDDGRFVLVLSWATNLVAGDTNGVSDVFVRDRQLGTLERVDVSSAGAQANAQATDCGISGDGRYVCFSSFASNLVAGDTNGLTDVFLRDRVAGTTERVSVDSAGAQLAGTSAWATISGGGRYVLFRSNTPNSTGLPWYRLWRRDLQLGLTEMVDPLPAIYGRVGSSFYPSISADGRFVAFQVTVTTAGTSSYRQRIFLFDAQSGTSIEVSTGPGGVPSNGDSMAPLLAPDASSVAFAGWSTNLIPGFTPDDYGALFLHDLASGTNEVLSTSSTGVLSHGANCYAHGLSNGGRFVSIIGPSTALAAGDTNGSWDVFLKDRLTGGTRRVSVTPAGAQLPNGGWGGALTPDGRFLTLYSDASTLVAGDTNGVEDAFLFDLRAPQSQTFCSALPNSLGCTPQLAGTGVPSLTAPQPFTLACTSLLNQQPTWLSYSVAPSSRRFHGVLLCIERPLTQLATQSSGGSTSGSDCSGSYAIDFNQRIQSGLDARLVPGTLVCVQVFSHDPLAPGGFSLSAGLAFTVQP